MAGSLGEAQLQLGVDTRAFQVGLNAALGDAQRKGAQIQKALEARQGKVDANTGLINRLQKEALSADSSRSALIRQRIGYLQQENKEQQAGIAVLRQKLAANKELTGEILKQQAAQKAAVAGVGGGLGGGLKALAGAAGLVGFGVITQQIAAAGQASEKSKIQLQALAGAYGEANAAMTASSRIAKVLGISTLEARSSFAQLYGALRGTGIGLQELEVLYVGLNKAARLSGAGAGEAAAGILQLRQAFASGRAQGDELRSVLENLPVFAQAVAAEMKVNVDELRQLGAEGKITSDILFNAAKSLATAGAPGKTQLESLASTFENVREAAAEAFGPALNSTLKSFSVGLRVIGSYLNENKGAIAGFAQGVASSVKAILPFAAGIGIVVTAFRAWRIAATAAAAAQAALLALTGPKGWAILAGAVAATGLAMAGLNKLSADAEKAMANAGAEAKKAAAEFDALVSGASVKSSSVVDAEIAKRAKASEDEYRMALRIQGLEGSALQAAQAQLQIDAARLKYKEAIAAAEKAPGNVSLQAASAAAGDELKTAMLSAGTAMKDAARNAADQLKSAGESLKSTLRSNFELLDKEIRGKLLEDARNSINASLATGRYDRSAVQSGIRSDRELLEMATRLEGINASFDAYSFAQMQLARTQEQIGTSFEGLGVKLDQTAVAVAELVTKDWNVYVTGQPTTNQNDTVAAVNRGF